LTFLGVNDIRGIASSGSKLWLATQGGAVSYDVGTGEERIFHRKRDALLSDSVSAVAVGPDGRVWLSTDRAGISVFDPQTEEWEPYTSQLRQIPGNLINRIRFDRDSLFVSAEQGFALFVGDEEPAFYLDGVSLGLPSPDVRDFAADPHGDGFWLSTAAGVVHRDSLDAYTVYPGGVGDVPGRLVRYQGRWVTSFGVGVSALDPQSGTWGQIAGGYPGEIITDLMAEGSDLYICTTDGPWKFDGAAYSRIGTEHFSSTSIFRGPDGKLYCGSADTFDESRNGLRWFDGTVWHRILFPGPTSRSNYHAIIFDANGVLHTTTVAPGFYQTFNGSLWSSPRGLSWWTADLLSNPGGGIWLAHCCCSESDTSGCPIELLTGGSTVRYSPKDLRDIAYDDLGNLWGASWGEAGEIIQGVWMLSAATGQWTQFSTATAGARILENSVAAILPVGREIWIGYADQGLHRWDLGADRIPLTNDDSWTHYGTSEPSGRQLRSDNINAIAIRGSRIWVGTNNGVTIVDPSGIRNIGTGFNGLPAPVVNAIVPLGDGGAWVALKDYGVTRIADTDAGFTFASYTPPDLPNPNVECLALDPDGRSLWAGTARGLSRITPVGSSGTAGVPAAVYPNPYVYGCGAGVRLFNVPGLVNGIIVDLTGREITRFEKRGNGDVVWDGNDRSGHRVASGLYMIRVLTSEGTRGIGVALVDGPCQ
jgi:streptogramin lyase